MKKLFLMLFVFANIFINAQVTDTKTEHNSIDSNAVLSPEPKFAKISKSVAMILSRYHYKKVKIDDSLSSEIFNNYLTNIDNNKMYFLASDINDFASYRYTFDENLLFGNLEPPFHIFNVFKERVTERIKYVEKLLENEFDYTADENYLPDRTKSSWAETVNEINEIWRKRVKNEALNMKLAGKEWNKTRETLLKRYQNFHKAVLQYKPEDVFQIYMNTYSETIDPHTSYFSQRSSDNFDIQMKLSLEGIGATLRTDNDYTKVVELVPGGPAAKSGLLKANDLISGVGQGEDGEIVDVIGWRIDDVVSLIRGKKGTVVRLQILKSSTGADMLPDTISIVRDKVKLEEQAAKSEIIEIESDNQKYKIGIVSIPSFYIDFEARMKGEPEYRSTTRDVKALLKQLNENKVDGIVIDLRNNGGGALQEAVELTGLFIKEGPVVQVKGTDGIIDVEKDDDPALYYEGPLAVLVNKFSASASEIFSGAIQDYGRGLIIGEQTYGKGTVQTLQNLDNFVPNEKNPGKLKFTIAKYYRINGSSTQHLGVIPDIIFPSSSDAKEYGESSNKSALPWDQIGSTVFSKQSGFQEVIPSLIKKHDERIKKDVQFQYIIEDIEEYNHRIDKNSFSLNYEIRKKEREEAELKKKERNENQDVQPEIDIEELEEIPVAKDKKDDPFLKETGYILADLIMLETAE